MIGSQFPVRIVARAGVYILYTFASDKYILTEMSGQGLAVGGGLQPRGHGRPRGVLEDPPRPSIGCGHGHIKKDWEVKPGRQGPN